MFTIYGALQPRSDVDRIYVRRKEGAEGLISIENCVELAIRGLKVHVHGIEEIFTQAARGDKIDRFKSCKCFEEIKERKNIRRLGGGSSIWCVFEAD